VPPDPGVASTGEVVVVATDPTLDELASSCVKATCTLLEEVRERRSTRDRRTRRRFERLFRDPAAIGVTMALTDQVMRAASAPAAVVLFRRASARASARGFGVVDAIGLRLLAVIARVAPRSVLRVVHARVRELSSELILPAEEGSLSRHVDRRRAQGALLNVNVLGEAVLGEGEAQQRLWSITAMMRRSYVDYVSVKLSSVVSQLSAFDVAGSQRRVAERLREIYRVAQREGVFVNLDMEEYRDLRLTLDAFLRVLEEPEFHSLSAGIVLQAYLPEAHGALEELIAWAIERRARGGAAIKVRLVKGANLAMEHAEAELQGFPAAPYASKADVDASYLRLVDRALRPQHADALRVGVASHNLFHLNFALEVAARRHVESQLDLEMLEGMANAEALVFSARGQRVILYAPVTRREDFAAAVAYLVRRLDENTSPENYLRAAFAIDHDSGTFSMQAHRFEEAVAARHRVVTTSRRHEERAGAPASFENAANADPTNANWRAAYEAALADVLAPGDVTIPLVIAGEEAESGEWERGRDPNDEGRVWYRYAVATKKEVDRAVAAARASHGQWANRPMADRREVLRRASTQMLASRARATAVMARDTGKTEHEANVEVSEGADFASFYAEHAVDAQEAHPLGVVVVVPPWNFPYAIPAGGVLAALAAGNAVILKPAPEAVGVAWELVRQLWRAGVPRDVLQFVPTRDDENGRALVAHEQVNAVILTGSFATAELFTSWRNDLCLLGETSGKNAVVVTSSADVDAAVKDLVDSAFSHAGQKCSAASLAIVDRSLIDGGAFLRQLRDAVESLAVGSATDVGSVVGPVIRPPEAALARALGQLDPGESWLVEPRALDQAGYLWRPGVRLGVVAGSWSHHYEWFGPVLGVMVAPDLETATRWQNEVVFGLTAGLHSLDDEQCQWWIEHVEAGNVYVNRVTTGAVVQRQPFGGWKRSSVGPTAKAGGAHYVTSLCSWPALSDTSAAVDELVAWWFEEGALVLDPSGLRVERNVHRFRFYPRHVVVRVDEHWSPGQDAFLAALSAITGASLRLSSVSSVATHHDLVVESPEELVARSAGWTKVRWLSREVAPALALLEQGCVLDRRPLAQRGAIEGPRWLLEQSVAVANHRYGNVGAGPQPEVPGLGGRDTGQKGHGRNG